MRVWAVLFCGWIGVGCGAAAPFPRLVVYAEPTPDPRSFLSPFAAEWFLRGELAMAGGNYAGAASAFRTALSGSEEDVLVIARLAESLDMLGDVAGRDAALARAEAVDPDSEALRLAQGNIAGRAGRVDEALIAYRRASDAAPRSEAPVLAASDLLRTHGLGARAESVLAEFVTRTGGRAAARARFSLALARRNAPGVVQAVAALRAQASVRAIDVCAAAEALREAGDPFSAKRVLESIDAGSECAALAVEIAVEVGSRSDLQAALLRVTPQALGDPLHAARLYLRAGNSAVAETLAREALARAESAEAYVTLGEALLAQGRYALAAEAFARVPNAASVSEIARSGLRQALGGGGLGYLASEVR